MLPAGRLIRPRTAHHRSSLLPDGIEIGSLKDHQITQRAGSALEEYQKHQARLTLCYRILT